MSVNIAVDLQMWHFLLWETVAMGLSKCPCGHGQNELSVIANYRGHIPSGFVEAC